MVLASRIALILLLVIVNAISLVNNYGVDELAAPLRFLSGEFRPDSQLYIHDIVVYKSKILIIQVFHALSAWTSLGPDFLRLLLQIFADFCTLSGLTLFLSAVGIGFFPALAGALGLFLFSPFDYLSFAYHYKMGRAGVTLGYTAFSVLTLLLALHFRRNYLLLGLGTLFLFCIHPLNALLIAGWVIFSFSLQILLERRWDAPSLRPFLGFSALLLGLLVASWLTYAGVVKKDNPAALYALIRYINGEGEAGGYFIPWLNPKRIFNEAVFLALSLGTFYFADKRRQISPGYLKFLSFFVIYSVLLCIFHYLFSKLQMHSLMALDVSRVIALARPLVYLGFLQIIYFRAIKEGWSVTLSAGLALLFLYVSTSTYTFPLVCATILGLWSPVMLFALWTVVILVSGFFRFDEAQLTFVLREQTLETLQFRATTLFVSLLGLLAAISPRFSARKLVRWVPLAVVGALLSGLYGARYAEKLAANREANENVAGLSEFLKSNYTDSDVLLTNAEQWSFLGLHPTFVAFHPMSYGIYVGNLEKLFHEAGTAWGLTPSMEQVEALGQKYSAGSGLGGFMDEEIQNLSAARMKKIKEAFPGFRLVMLTDRQEFTDPSLPLKLVYANKMFRLYEVPSPR